MDRRRRRSASPASPTRRRSASPAGLLSLPRELQARILRQTDRESLRNLTEVNSAYRTAFRPVLDRRRLLQRGDFDLTTPLYDIPAEELERPLQHAVNRRDPEAVRRLLRYGAPPDDAFQLAAGQGFLEIVRVFVESGVNPTYGLSEAAYAGHLPIVEYLLNHGADIHADNDSAVRWAARGGHRNVIRALVERGANIRAYGDDALRQAYRRGGAEAYDYVETLIRQGYGRVDPRYD